MGMPLDLLWLTIPAYVVLQIVALTRSSGGSRVAAALPLFVIRDPVGHDVQRLQALEFPQHLQTFVGDLGSGEVERFH